MCVNKSSLLEYFITISLKNWVENQFIKIAQDSDGGGSDTMHRKDNVVNLPYLICRNCSRNIPQYLQLHAITVIFIKQRVCVNMQT